MSLYVNTHEIPNSGDYVKVNNHAIDYLKVNNHTVWEKIKEINVLSGFNIENVNGARNDWRVWSYNTLLTSDAYTSIINNLNAYDDDEDWSNEDHLCLPWSGLAIPSASLIDLSKYRYLTLKVQSSKTSYLDNNEIAHEIAFYNSSGDKVAAYFLQPNGPVYNTSARSNHRDIINLSIPHASVSHIETDGDDNFEWYDITHTNNESRRYYSEDLFIPIQYEIDNCGQTKNGYPHTYISDTGNGYFYVTLDIPSGISSGTIMILDGFATSGGGRGHTFNMYECILRK